MGIKKLHSFLNYKHVINYHNNIDSYIRYLKKNLNIERNIVIGIDALLYAHKFKFSTNDIIYGFLNQALFLLSNKIIPIYIIDGKASEEKNITNDIKNKNKDKLYFKLDELKEILKNTCNIYDYKNISIQIKKLEKKLLYVQPSDIENIIDLMKILNINCIRCQGEADIYLSNLYKKNIIDCILSEDTDMLTFGCSRLIKFDKKKIIEYNLNFILDKLQINYFQFIELCILFGCDYLRSPFKINPNEIFDLYKYYNHNSTLLIENEINNNDYIDNFNKIKKFFYNNDCHIDNLHIDINYIDKNKLDQFLNNNKYYKINFNIYYMISHINKINNNNKQN